MLSKVQHKEPSIRPYQQEQVNQIHEQWALGNLKVLCVSSTGSGKTTVAGFVIKAEAERGGRIMIVTDRKKLTRQFAHRTETDFGIPCGIEMAQEGHDGEQCISATVQTITSRIASGKFHPEEVTLLIFDESHLALGAGFQSVAKHFSKARILGLTATPLASGQKDLLKFFDVKVEPITLKELIEQEWLAPITAKSFPIQIKLEASSKSADFKDEDISHAIDPYLESCADELIKMGRDRCCLAFLPLIKTSQKFSRLLNERGFKSEHVDGTMTEKEVNEALSRLEMGVISCLTCSMLLAIGVDCKPVNMILSLRPTKSWTLFVQQVGRGTRTFDPTKDGPPGTKWPRKTDLLLCDPLWLTDQHSLMQRPSRLFAKDNEEAERIDKHIRKGSGNLLDALSGAANEREEQLRKRLEEMSRRTARMCNALELGASLHRPDLAEYTPLARWEEEPMSEPQRAWLEKVGIDLGSINGRGHASQILDVITMRAKKKLCTIKQARYCQALGMEDPWNASFDSASKFISEHTKTRR